MENGRLDFDVEDFTLHGRKDGGNKMKYFLFLIIIYPQIVSAEWVCPLTNGCPIDNKGICIGCVESEPPKPTISSNPPVISKPPISTNPPIVKKKIPKKKIPVKKYSYLEEGKYHVDRVVNERGFELKWERGVVLEIENLSRELYLVKLTGSATLSNGERMNCNPPTIYSMKLDNKGNQLSQKVLDVGNRSCHISGMKKDRWISTPFKIIKKKQGRHRNEILTYHYMKFKEPNVVTDEVEETETVAYVETSTNTKKPFWNEKGVEMCWFPELGWPDASTGKPLGEYRDCNWRNRGNMTADAIKRGTKECGGYMNWVWTDEHHSKYRCN